MMSDVLSDEEELEEVSQPVSQEVASQTTASQVSSQQSPPRFRVNIIPTTYRKSDDQNRSTTTTPTVRMTRKNKAVSSDDSVSNLVDHDSDDYSSTNKPPVSSISISSTDSDTASGSGCSSLGGVETANCSSLSNSAGGNSGGGRTGRSSGGVTSKGTRTTTSSSAYNHLSTKTATAERLSKASNKSTKKNRSHELEPLKKNYDTFCKQFKPFLGSLKSYHKSLVELEKSRSEVLKNIEIFTQNTPLAEPIGKVSSIVSANPQSWARAVAKNERTFCAQGQLVHALNTKYAQQIDEECIEYVQEWETVVTARINSSLSKAEDLLKTCKHYEKKVNQLHDSENKSYAAKGKTPGETFKDKLRRNKEKLAVAQEDYEKYATTVCHLMDSVLDCAWRDMTPLMFQLASMELARIGGGNNNGGEVATTDIITNSLSDLVDNLKDFSREHKIAL